MRGDVIYQVFGLSDKETHFGSFRTHEEAREKIEQLRKSYGQQWVNSYHWQGFVVREKVVDTDFEIPSRPKPRDKYFLRRQPISNGPGRWDSASLEVYRRDSGLLGPKRVAKFVRNYNAYIGFEPFRQGEREFALVARNYTRTAVLDLSNGNFIAEEPETDPPGNGFCPAGFYVPDWWDINDDSILPGSDDWSEEKRWPEGNFGFVWGCIWGDDSSWKVQWLDLSRVQEGVIAREPRFGYLELATRDYLSPVFSESAPGPAGSKPPPFIRVSGYDRDRVEFDVEMAFEIGSGAPTDWERKRNSNWD